MHWMEHYSMLIIAFLVYCLLSSHTVFLNRMFHVSDLILKDLVCYNVTISFYLFVHLSKNATIITWFSVSNCTRSACFGFISYGSKDIIMELVNGIGTSGVLN
ncbi:hypothetical protein OIU78_005691 [Salix suchowensis]|nr:hypothetical protein OIU78_005691 [Salix suchowensis]